MIDFSSAQHLFRCRAALWAAVSAAVFLAACGGSGNGGRLAADELAACAIATDSGSVIVGSGLPGDPAAPEPASGYRLGRHATHSASYMVVTANPLASKAGCEVLQSGGSAVDAAVVVQMVLGLVEPQSSGIGGGAFMLYRDAASGALVAYDGRETAPAAATSNYLRYIDDESDRNPPLPSARASGRSIGTPGVLRMLELAHQEYGRLPWQQLFSPAVDLAESGFAVSARMAAALAGARDGLLRDSEAAALYFDAQGQPLPRGAHFSNRPYAQTLRTIAQGGADAFYRGELAQAMIEKIGSASGADGSASGADGSASGADGSASGADGSAITPGKTTLQDLADYRAKKREAVCTSYRARFLVCSMPPPSSGGIAVAQALGILENFDLAQYPPTQVDEHGGKPAVMGVHLVSEALRLAYADRDRYVADSDFVPLPGGSPARLLDKDYLRQRAALISRERSMGTAQPGDFGAPRLASVPTPEAGTTHFSIVDAKGNALSMTTTVEASMGSWHVTRGFVLNNQLTDFSSVPETDAGPVANRVEPGKRPRSSMAPTLVFDMAADADPSVYRFKMATGSPGGSAIIQYVTKTLVGVLDWELDAQQATSMVDFGAANSATTNIGGEHPHVNAANDGRDDPLVAGLRALGHTVSVRAQSSGIGTIVRVPRNGQMQLQGGADPRREGLVLGDGVH